MKTHITRLSIIALAIALLIFNWYFVAVFIESTSMKPTLNEGGIILMRRLTNPGPESLEYTDLVMFDYKHKRNVLKRVIGMPGDMIMFDNKTIYLKKVNSPAFIEITNSLISHGKYNESGYPLSLYENEINGHKFKVAITGVVPQNDNNFFLQENMPVGQWLVPAKSIFVMGDNRDFSMDSRYIGFIDIKSVVAKSLGDGVGEQ